MQEEKHDQVSVHQFNGNRIETHIIEGEAWFIAKEVCDVLEIANNRNAVSRLSEDESMSIVRTGTGGARTVTAVNEPGLYRLIFQSRKPEAEAFKNWIFREVIPSVMRTGSYAMPGKEPLSSSTRQDRILDLLEKALGLIIEQNRQLKPKPRRAAFTTEEKEEIWSQYESGRGPTEIAENFGSTCGSISSCITRMKTTA